MLKKTGLTMAVLFAVLLLGFFGVKLYADRHYYDGYEADLPLNASATDPVPVEKEIKSFDQPIQARYRLQRIEFEARPDERVPALMTLPFEAESPVPAIVLLHGSHQQKDFVEEICTPFNEAGFAMVCFDQYMRGERRVRGNMRTMAMAYRERSWKTVHDTRRLIDYLQTRPDIDPDRIYLVGASYGAITGTVVLAHDKRLKAGVLVVGGGNLRLFAKAPEVRREVPAWLLPALGSLIAFLIGPAEPVLHAPFTAGTPVLMQNGSNDGVIIPESGKALFAALGEPKEIRWYPIDHPDREENGEKVIELLLDGLVWLREIDEKSLVP